MSRKIVSRSILAEAQGIVSGPRHKSYGTWRENFERIAAICNQLGLSCGEVTAADCARIMLAVKLARHAHQPKRDNLVDLAGYAEGLSQIEEGRDA